MPYRIGSGGTAIARGTFSGLPSTRDDLTLLRGGGLAAHYPFMPGWAFRGRADLGRLPCRHARSLPGGPARDGAHAAMKAESVARLRATGPRDGLSRDPHGAISILGRGDAAGDRAPELCGLARVAYLALTAVAVERDSTRLPHARLWRPIFPLDPRLPDPTFDIQLFGA